MFLWKKSGRLEKSWKQGRRSRKSAGKRSKMHGKQIKCLWQSNRISDSKQGSGAVGTGNRKMTETLANNQEMFETLKTQEEEAEANRKREAADIQKKMLALEQSFLSYEALQNARSEEQEAKKVWKTSGKHQRSHSIRKRLDCRIKRTAEAKEEQVVEQTKKNWEQTSLSASESAEHYEHMYEAF